MYIYMCTEYNENMINMIDWPKFLWTQIGMIQRQKHLARAMLEQMLLKRWLSL